MRTNKKILLMMLLIISLIALGGCITGDSGIIITESDQIVKVMVGDSTLLKTDSDSVIWESNNETIATVDNLGIVTGVGPGIATITATANKSTSSILVSVSTKNPKAIIDITGKQVMNIKDSQVLTANVHYSETIPPIYWESSDENIATVSEYGNVIAKSSGITNITATIYLDEVITSNIAILVKGTGETINTVINNEITKETVEIIGNIDLTSLSSVIMGIVEKSTPAVVGVSNYQFYTSGGVTTLERTGIGTGIIFKKIINNDNTFSYWVLTNYHVVEDYNEIRVYFGEEDSEIKSDISLTTSNIKASKTLDLSIFRFTTTKDITPLKFGKASDVKLGDFCIAIGNPTGYEYFNSATFGMISYPNRAVSSEVATFVQHDAAINPGNSGGPLLNLKGEVIGVNTLKIVSSDVDNMGFAISLENVITFVENFELK